MAGASPQGDAAGAALPPDTPASSDGPDRHVYIARLARLTILGATPAWRGAALALLLTGAAALLRWALSPIGPDIAPFATFYVSTMLAALLGGAAAGALGLVLAGFIAWLAFLPPAWTLALPGQTLANLALFAGTQAAVVALAVVLRNALHRAATAEAELQARLAELEALMDLVPAGIWFARGPEVRAVTRNRFAAEMLRVPAGTGPRDQAPGLVSLGHVALHEDGAPVPPDRMPLQRALDGEELRNHEYDAVFADGEAISMLFNARPIRDRAGRITAAVSAGLDVTALKRTEAALREAIAARELLQREADHRIKNSLQLVISVLRVQRGRVHDPQAVALLDEALARIAAVAEAHAALQRSPDLRDAEAGRMLEELAGFVGRLDPAVTIRCARSGDTRLEVERAIPLGLLVTELLTNAVRHAYPGRAGGVVELRVAGREDGALEVTVSDRGIGMGEAPSPGSLGRELVRAMAAKVGAEVATRSMPGAGTEVTLRIPRGAEAPATPAEASATA
jgi:two-component sensor histidine kinase